MAEKITDKQVQDLVAILRTDASVDAKVAQVTAIKSGIKQHNVPDNVVAPLFEALRAASTAQHAQLVSAGFTGLNHLLTRLSRQEPKFLLKEAARTLPLIIEKLGDQKEKFRQLASQSLTTLYAAAPMDVERSVRNTAMVGKNTRAKEASLHWLLQMHQEAGLQFRSYVPTLMELLEDADPTVREVAKTTVIELFRSAPNAAKSDLKKQLKNFKVRPAIEQAIVKELAPTSARPETPAEAPAPPVRPNLAASVSSLVSERPITPMVPENKPEAVEPSYVNTQRELDDIFKEMAFHFDGKETEQNWLKREESMTRCRRLLAGNAPSDFPENLLAGLRGLMDGTIKAVTSLRTSLSKEGCSLVQDIAITYGPAMDPMVELFMQTFIKLAAATKKISSQLANMTVDTIIGRVSYNARIMQHIWGACQDKNVQPRLYATGWLKTLLNKEAHHKNHVEHTGGLDLIEKCIKKGLNDANPGVREKMRSTYWAFAGVWPIRAEAIMAGLDATAQKLLNNDSNNPNSPKKAATEGPVRPGLGLSKSTMGSGKPSLREAMMAQKKATLAARNLPARPGSAMSHFSPVRTASNTSTVSAASSATTSTVRSRAEATISVGPGGMSGAPMRPARKRPEITRPATAGPYSVRSHDTASREATSPSDTLKTKTMTPKAPATTASPRRTVPRPRPGHATHASESSLPSPTRPLLAKGATSPRVGPAKLKQAHSALVASSPSKANEELTLLVPNLANLKASSPESTTPPAKPLVTGTVTAAGSSTPSKTLQVYEDPFVDNQDTPKATFTGSVLEDVPINESAANIARLPEQNGELSPVQSPDKARQNSRLLDSGITRVKAKSLDVHGFRKLQSLLRESKAVFTDEKFDALLLGLFEYLESPLATLAPEKVQDVKAQILATIKLLLKKERDNFQPHVSRGLESMLRTRSAYDARTHIVSGLELLADELVTLGDAPEMIITLTKMLQGAKDTTVDGARCLTMGLHVLKELLEKRTSFVPSDAEIALLAGLTGRCIESTESGVRRDAVQLCVALHARVGEARFWEAHKGIKDDPKSLITYYIVKRQREAEGQAA